MKNNALHPGNENGAALVVAMILLAMLTLIGLMSIGTSNTELEVVRNEVLYKRNFMLAESANAMAMGKLDDMEQSASGIIQLRTYSPQWLHNANAGMNAPDFEDPNNWDSDDIQDLSSFDSNLSDMDDTYFAVTSELATGSSVGMSGTGQVTLYHVYGLYKSDVGQVIVHSGFVQ